MSLQRVSLVFTPFIRFLEYKRLDVLKEKSRNMNLKFKSTEADLKFKLQSDIRILNQNTLYCSKQLDWLVSEFRKYVVDKNLQKQVDEYFEDVPEEDQGVSGEAHPDIDPYEPKDSQQDGNSNSS